MRITPAFFALALASAPAASARGGAPAFELDGAARGAIGTDWPQDSKTPAMTLTDPAVLGLLP